MAPPAALLALAEEVSARAALSLLALRVAEQKRLVPALRSWASVRAAARELKQRTAGALPPWALPAREPAGFRDLGPSSLTEASEALSAQAISNAARRRAGLYYTPAEVADEVVALALRHGAPGADALVLDPCAGAGAFLVAAARRGVRRCAGMDLDPDALRVARAALALEGIAAPLLSRGDSLRRTPPLADLLVSNPPYGHIDEAEDRAAVLALFPALRGGEIDRYAAYLLRSLSLVRPGGTVALLIPDTWMSNARAGALRTAVLDAAAIAAVVDLGKPFAAAKDTRVQALVLVRSEAQRSRAAAGARAASVASTFVGRAREELAPVARAELERGALRGWQLYRSRGERALCEAMEAAGAPLGTLCDVGYGLRTGDNGRHVLRRAPGPGELGLVGGEDILPFGLRWKPKALRDPAEFEALVSRQTGRERVAIQRIRTNAQAPWARWLEAAIVPRELVCLDSLSTLACDDHDRLWALLALVGSVALNRYHRLQTTDVNVKPSLLRQLPVPAALAQRPQRLAQLSRRRAASGDVAVERAIDAEVYRLFELDEELVSEAERGFWGETRFAEEKRRLDLLMSDPPAMVAGNHGDRPC